MPVEVRLVRLAGALRVAAPRSARRRAAPARANTVREESPRSRCRKTRAQGAGRGAQGKRRAITMRTRASPAPCALIPAPRSGRAPHLLFDLDVAAADGLH